MTAIRFAPVGPREPGRPVSAGRGTGEADPESPRLVVMFNRDEQRSRSPGLPPTRREIEGVPVVMPIDADGGGTWIAANAHGLVLTILNLNLAREGEAPAGTEVPSGGWRSRGLIIPAIAGAPSVEAAAGLLRERVDHRDYRPFRLAILHADEPAMLVVRSTTAEMSWASAPLDRPLMLTSSGLGDHVVEPPRRALFDGWFAAPDADVPQAGKDGSAAGAPLACGGRHWMQDRQHALHRHAWPDAGHVSVLMSRRDARTFSWTSVEVGRERTLIRHLDLPDDRSSAAPGGAGMRWPSTAEPSLLELPLLQRVNGLAAGPQVYHGCDAVQRGCEGPV